MADDVGTGPVKLSLDWWKYGNTFHYVHIHSFHEDSIFEKEGDIKYELTACGKKVVYDWKRGGKGNYCNKCRRMKMMEQLAE